MKNISNISRLAGLCALTMLASVKVQAQVSSPPNHPTPVNPDRIRPEYPLPYGPPTVKSITAVLDRVESYLQDNTPARLVNRQTGASITDLSKPDREAIIERGAFPIISYEWGVTYSGMLLAYENTGDPRFKDYVQQRLQFIAEVAPYFGKLYDQGLRGWNNPLRSVLHPGSLDDSGSMCAAMIKAQRAGLADLRPLINRYADYISTKQYRLPDGTLARNRPFPNSLWLDDLYMSVPALAQMGKLTGDGKYYDDAVKQIRQFSARMFDRQKDLYMHGWVEGMKVHPEFCWARANGWALMAMTELLSVLPEGHPGREAVLGLLREQIRGLAARQGPNGLWHQLLDHNDSYFETSASAIYTYCIARAINRGWIDPLAYGPVAMLGWNGLTTRVNAQGQVEGTCVGTGMGFDPAFYYARPRSVYAAHGYGPVLLAGAEMIKLVEGHPAAIKDGALELSVPPGGTNDRN